MSGRSNIISGCIPFFLVCFVFYGVIRPYGRIKDLQDGMEQQQKDIKSLTDQLHAISVALRGGSGGGDNADEGESEATTTATSDTRGLLVEKKETIRQQDEESDRIAAAPPAASPAKQVKTRRQAKRDQQPPPSQAVTTTTTNAKDKSKMTIPELELAFHQERYLQLQDAPEEDMLVWNASYRIPDPYIGMDGLRHPGGHRIYDRLLNNFDYCEIWSNTNTLPTNKECKFILARGDRVKMGGLCHAASVITKHRQQHNIPFPHVLFFSFHEDFGGMSTSLKAKKRQGCGNEQQVWDYINHPDTIAAFTVQTHHTDHPKIHSIALGYRFMHQQGKTIYQKLHSHTPQDSVNKKKKVMFNNNISHNGRDRRACLGNLTKNFEGIDPPIHNTFSRKNTLENYYEEMIDSQFIVSPKGQGGDCYRNYEAIFMGCIPIIEIEKETSADTGLPQPREKDGWRRLFDDLPVVFVKSWEGVTLQFVQKEYRRILEGGPYNFKKTLRSWWIQHIHGLVENHVASF